MTIECTYGDGFTRRQWTNADGNHFKLVSDAYNVTITGDMSRETDVDTFKAQLNNAISDWRTYRSKEEGREHVRK